MLMSMATLLRLQIMAATRFALGTGTEVDPSDSTEGKRAVL